MVVRTAKLEKAGFKHFILNHSKNVEDSHTQNTK